MLTCSTISFLSVEAYTLQDGPFLDVLQDLQLYLVGNRPLRCPMFGLKSHCALSEISPAEALDMSAGHVDAFEDKRL
jgi:hypothetical protein